MRSHNSQNERIKRQYFAYLREAHQQSPASVDAAAKAISRFEVENRHRDFKTFHVEQAIAFKRALRDQLSSRSGEKLSTATLQTTTAHVKRFFVWLAAQPGYRSRLKYSDADYFNLSEKEKRVACARRERPGPTLEQVKHAIESMSECDDVSRRDKAIVAFTLLTGARDGAIVSFQLGHLDSARRCIEQDARVVKTKYSKTFTTFFFPVGEDIANIVLNWAQHLRTKHLMGNQDPLFPATEIRLGTDGRFQVAGLSRRRWADAAPVRAIFRRAFLGAGLPYFNPHSFRKTLAQLGEARCQTPEEFKAWSQNLGHEGVLTTFNSYGAVAAPRQGEIMDALSTTGARRGLSADDVADAVFRRFQREQDSPASRTGGVEPPFS